jgi:hypothetical protein
MIGTPSASVKAELRDENLLLTTVANLSADGRWASTGNRAMLPAMICRVPMNGRGRCGRRSSVGVKMTGQVDSTAAGGNQVATGDPARRLADLVEASAESCTTRRPPSVAGERDIARRGNHRMTPGRNFSWLAGNRDRAWCALGNDGATPGGARGYCRTVNRTGGWSGKDDWGGEPEQNQGAARRPDQLTYHGTSPDTIGELVYEPSNVACTPR